MSNIYDCSGNILSQYTTPEDIKSDMLLMHGYDSVSNTRYTVARIFKQKVDGTFQFPFVRYSFQDGIHTAITLRQVEGWDFIINGALEAGLLIENSVVFSDTAASTHAGAMPLTINSNGDLSYTEADTTGKGAQYVAQGIVSALCGFFPIVEDYDAYDYPSLQIESVLPNARAQRQVIGQYSNGDYCIITSEGRNFAGSDGFTVQEVQDLCLRLGLKFAYNLDGGGSTQTLYGKKRVNEIYEGTTGRGTYVFIVFNGTNTFSIPPA